MPRLIQELVVARADGRYSKVLTSWSKLDLIVIDDFGLSQLTPDSTRDLLEVLDDRYDTKSTLIASQLPVSHWHETMQDPTLADAVLDRLVHNAYRIELKGDSMRKKRKKGE